MSETANPLLARERLEPIPMQDAELLYLRQLSLAEAPHIVMRRLIDEVPWRAQRRLLFGAELIRSPV